MKHIPLSLFLIIVLLVSATAHAALTVKVGEPKQIGKKVVIKLTMKNTFKESVESARAQVFLMDDKGKVVRQAVRWVIGGTRDKPALTPDAETVFNFVVEAEKPFATKTVSFTRLILEGGKVADVNQNVLLVVK